MINKLSLFVFLIVFLSSCSSVEKYNKQISQLHPASELHEDVDYAYNLLQKLHPNLYEFTSKDSLDKAFSNLKSSINKPLSSRDFYKRLAFVIKKIGQGHTSASPPYLRQTKKEKKKRGKRSGPLKPLKFNYLNKHLWIEKVYNKDTFLLASEVLKVNNESVRSIMKSIDSIIASDGHNTTFYPRIKGLYFSALYGKLHTKKDTIQLELKQKDSVFTYSMIAQYKKGKKEKKDSLQLNKELTKEAKKRAKAERNRKEEWEEMHGYDSYTKESLRSFHFIDSLNETTAYIKIRRFKNGRAKDFYKEVFQKIDSAQVKNLIIDLRENLGGALAQIDELYSYLTDKDYQLLEESRMNHRFSYIHPYIHSKSGFIKALTWITSPIHTIYFQVFKVKTRNHQHYLQLKQSKLRKPKENNYKGNLYVLINGTSFSASATLSTHLKATKRAVFVGEETGGTYNATVAGIFDYPVLPHSKVSMRFGVMTIKTPYTATPNGYGVKPDIYIPTTTLEKDEQMEWVLKHIQDIGDQ